MKTIPFIFFLALSIIASAQSKKEQIKQLNKERDSLKLALDNEKLRFKKNEKLLTNQIKSLQKDLSSKTDSISVKSKDKNIELTFEITYASLDKPATDSMKNIQDWLEQFTLLHEGKTTFYDEKTALFYSGEEIESMAMGIVNIEHAIYKEGIIFSKRYEHEGALYQLFIPMLSEKDIKKNIERLCKNMGGCVPVEEMLIEYEQTEFGIRISWGGGC